ncbi:hypothetical protein F5Y11DRAFT_329178 [Daldinia sp. FL1419]|nr:hypothetical protein F5Y11DRAFT_329178 [Daldinia sp. FL1419]
MALSDTEEDQDIKFEEEEVPYYDSPVQGTKSSEQDVWEGLQLADQCQKVMDSLKQGERRWDETSGNSDIPILEGYKKVSLTETDSRHYKHAPTALHLIALYWKEKYSNYPAVVCRTVIRYLLEHRDKSLYGPQPGGTTMEEPFLKVAIESEGDGFIDCVMRCSPETFPDLLHVSDNDKRNCIHNIYVMPSVTILLRNSSGKNKLDINEVRKAAVLRAEKFIPFAKPETLAAKDKDGNTPLHYAMHFQQCYGRGDRYVNILQDMVLKADKLMKRNTNGSLNNKGESPILYHNRTRIESESRKQAKHTGTMNQPYPLPQTGTSGGRVRANITAPKAQPTTRADITGFREGQETMAILWDKPKQPQHAVISSPPDLRSKPTASKLEPKDGAPEGFGLRRAASAIQPSINPLDTKSIPAPISIDGQLLNEQAKSPAPSQVPPSRPKKSGVNPLKSVETLIEFFTLHYIRTRSDLEARELIYGKDASDRNLYFDASELKRKEAEKITRLIDRMLVGGFNDTLAYVYLPIVLHIQEGTDSSPKSIGKSYPMNQGLARKSNTTENPYMGRSSLIEVFDKLYTAGVRNILRLHVEDSDSPSHTDAAIEKALQGRDSLEGNLKSRPILVETWDWRKPDLSIDVIAFAASTVEHINLYWSGNQTILRAWSCLEGIPRLFTTGNKRLQSVTLHVAPGLETISRMEKSLERFKIDVGRYTDNRITIRIKYQMTTLRTKLDNTSETSDSTEGNIKEEAQHAWIKTMEEFRRPLRDIHSELENMRARKPERVKVALIDDGVDLSKLESYNGIVSATGLSYYPRDGMTERPWHSSSSGHGTVMANMILRINPYVSLHVMKLKDSMSIEGKRTIFAESAANAIWGAIHKQVDIISISWTVDQKLTSSLAVSLGGSTGTGVYANETGSEDKGRKETYNDRAIRQLDEAVKAAVAAKILIFCSASDDIQAGSKDSLPFRAAPESIFRIGAALAQGQRDPHSEDTKQISYFFPGNKVADPVDPRSANIVKYHDGSSVATALAAGLASLIIYCATIMRTYHEKRAGAAVEYSQYIDALKLYKGMETAFSNIESDSWLDKKYLPVWAVFGKEHHDFSDKSGERKLEELDLLVKFLCSKVTTKAKVITGPITYM